jgi:hypothetical protein
MLEHRSPMSGRPDPLLRALVQAAAPRSIVEIAGPGETQARVLLETTSADATRVHLVGAAGETLAEELRARFGERVEAHDGLTMNVVASMTDAPDLVILGGDPNWYTVFHVLRLLARLAAGAPYPVVLVRHTGWPYGRRDAYPVLDAVPAAYLQPHARRGVRPEKTELDHTGLHPDVHHSLFENTEKNGVRTAVEDFVAQSDVPLEALYVPGFHGVTLLVDRRRAQGNDALATLLRELVATAPIASRLEELERARVDAQLALAAEHAKSERRAMERTELAGRLAELKDALDRSERELASALDAASKEQLRVAETRSAQSALEALVTSVEAELREARSRIAALAATNQHLEGKLERAEERERTVAELETELAALRGTSHRAAAAPAPAPTGASAPARKQSKSARPTNGAKEGSFARAVSGAMPSMVSPAAVELASRRFAKLRRDPKLFLAHSRF